MWKDNKTWRLKTILLKNEWANQEVKEEIKNTWEPMKMITPQTKTYGTQQRQS